MVSLAAEAAVPPFPTSDVFQVARDSNDVESAQRLQNMFRPAFALEFLGILRHLLCFLGRVRPSLSVEHPQG